MTQTEDRPVEVIERGRGRSVDPTVRQRARRIRVLAGAVVVVIAFAIFAAANAAPTGGDLNPTSYTHGGTHAVAALLGQRGVHVTTATEPAVAIGAAKPGTTLVVVFPERLTSDQLGAIAATRADLVIVGADIDQLQALGFPVSDEGAGADDKQLHDPKCTLPAASVAGNADMRGDGYTVPDGGTGCYPDAAGDPMLVSFSASGRQVTFLGDGTLLENSWIARDGNAALALGLLDEHPDVEWLVPTVGAQTTTGGGQATLTSLLPSRLVAAFWQLVIAIVIIAIWRGRRLGRLVPEQLPVVVRQSETVRGRARLYRRSRSLDRAADALRAGTRHRLGMRLGLGATPQRVGLVQAVADRCREPAAQIDALLYGSTPADDHALVTLASELTTLEQEVLRT